uniref:InlB B-repeat-containing protein n=1 Tax=Ruminococcus bromii TaxID=40518 RepID=UPI0040298E44
LVCNIHTLKKSHDYKTYNTIISNFSNKYFARVSYSNYISNTGTVYRIATQSKNTTIIFNENDIAKLETIYNNNSDVCDWDLSDPTTWNGIIWNDNGNVESIDFSYMNLEGTLDLSNFSSLKSLNLSGNNLTSVNLDNCSSLEEIDCSFNKLTTLDLSDCTNLTSVTCCYNYLDTHEGSTLYNKLDDLMFSDCYVNYYPQSVPDNATFDTTELNALKTFANTNNNNTALNWLDDGGNIDTEKLQNNVLFEYDGSKHHVVAIDISDLDISGTLDLTSLSLLQEICCENTKITTLNIKGCTKLETLKCDGCELTSITLPSNANAKTSSLYDVSCEYNYLDTSIFTQDVIKYVEFKAGGEIQYKNQKGDSSALQAALYFANKLDEKDYSEETFTPFKELIDECNAYNYDNLYLTQEDIDEITTNILVSMYELKAYFKVNISSSNGSFTVNDEKSNSNYKQSLLYGTTVTLNAVPNEGYIFVGWYDTVNNIYMSKKPEYTFKVSTNTDLKAVFIAEGSATLTFVNHSNWVAGTFTKSTAEWAEVTSINDLLPEVPFRFGYSNGRWVYDEQEVFSKLQAGEDVVIGAEYDEDDASFPTPSVAKDKPVLELYYKYNEENTLGTFMMAAGFPENIKVESVGIAFYYKKADLFDPRDNFTLLLNNKMMIGRFNTEQLEDIYIINMHKMTSTYNWAARGFVTYYDSNGNLVTEYSNQINIIDRQNTDEIK